MEIDRLRRRQVCVPHGACDPCQREAHRNSSREFERVRHCRVTKTVRGERTGLPTAGRRWIRLWADLPTFIIHNKSLIDELATISHLLAGCRAHVLAILPGHDPLDRIAEMNRAIASEKPSMGLPSKFWRRRFHAPVTLKLYSFAFFKWNRSPFRSSGTVSTVPPCSPASNETTRSVRQAWNCSGLRI